jgi:hypothetical protein
MYHRIKNKYSHLGETGKVERSRGMLFRFYDYNWKHLTPEYHAFFYEISQNIKEGHYNDV